MTQSPVKKKPKLRESNAKRNINLDSLNSMSKRFVNEESPESIESKIIALKKKNFIKACEKVSKQSYFDYKKRFMLFTVTKCMNGTCKHKNPSTMVCIYIWRYIGLLIIYNTVLCQNIYGKLITIAKGFTMIKKNISYQSKFILKNAQYNLTVLGYGCLDYFSLNIKTLI